MKPTIKILLSFVIWAILASMVAEKLYIIYQVPVLLGFGILFVLTLAVAAISRETLGNNIVFRSDVDVNIWAREIIKRWRKDNKFLAYAVNENKYVIGGAAVLIPQPGAKPIVVKNRSSFPATTIRRSDTTVLYALDEYSTNPTHITLNELQSISYDKMNDIISDHFMTLIENMSDDMLVKWATDLSATNIIYTTGDATEALESGQTGLRKAMIYRDLARAQAVMNKANVDKTGRIALIEENMFQQFADSLMGTTYRDAIKEYNTAEGTVGRLFGFDIMTRSSVATAASALDDDKLAVNALDAAIAADDDVVSLCWQRGVVANATGSVNLFNRSNDPLFYGDVNSVSARAGGRVRRADELGIIAIKQGKV